MINKKSNSVSYLMDGLGVGKLCTRKNLDYSMVAFSVFLSIYLNWSLIYTMTFVFVVWQILHPFSSQIIAKISVSILVLTLFSYMFKRGVYADGLAEFAYFFLILTAIMLIAERYRHRKK